MTKVFKVKFIPDDKTTEVAAGTTIFSAALACGLPLNSACGGEGSCGKCKVIIREGNTKAFTGGYIKKDKEGIDYFLACLTPVNSNLIVEIPQSSRLAFHENLNVSCASTEVAIQDFYLWDDVFEKKPLTKKIHLRLPIPDENDTLSDLDRLYRELKKHVNNPVFRIEHSLLRNLSQLLRSSDWEITVTIAEIFGLTEIMAIEAGNSLIDNYGIAFDIGTTNVGAELLDLNSFEVLSSKTSPNSQALFGPDIITRIIHAGKKDGLKELQESIIETMNVIISDMANENNINLNQISCIVCAGNTTMMHLLLGVNPAYIRQNPYIPCANSFPHIKTYQIKLIVNPNSFLYCVPGVSSYVGGDITCGVLSSRLYAQEELSLLIDIGTNGEIALGCKDFIITCAASAGPAFEGSGVSCGMRALSGAIESVCISEDYSVSFRTISGIKPKGICGSGFISLISQMLDRGLMNKNGKINKVNCSRIRVTDLGKEFVVVPKEETDTNSDIVITEADIDNLKRSKAAIYSAVAAILKHTETNITKIGKIFIAGGFGLSLDIENAIKIGLLPDIERSRYVFIGNSSLKGARQILLSTDAFNEAKDISNKITYFELSTDSSYMDEYVSALFFPHTDLSKFPSLSN